MLMIKESGISNDLSHQLTDVIARIVVEMAKREWPQHWTTMVDELCALSSQGNIQAEIVLRTFLRLSEDLIQLQVPYPYYKLWKNFL